MVTRRKARRQNRGNTVDPVRAANFKRNLLMALDRVRLTADDLRRELSEKVYRSLDSPRSYFKGPTLAKLERMLKIYDARKLFDDTLPPLYDPQTPARPASLMPQPNETELVIHLLAILARGTQAQILAVTTMIEATYATL